MPSHLELTPLADEFNVQERFYKICLQSVQPRQPGTADEVANVELLMGPQGAFITGRFLIDGKGYCCIFYGPLKPKIKVNLRRK